MSQYNNFKYEDPYNYHSLQRNETMQLNTINRQDIGYPKFQTQAIKDYSLRTDDLKGSQPKGEYPYQSKVTYANRSDDIKGAQPKQLIFNNREPQYQDNTLKIDDINGARPNICQFKTNRVGNNPLEPVYQLPQVQLTQPEVLKFLRNTLDISDIDGTRPKKDTSFIPKRNPIQYEEIAGSKPRKQYVPNNIRSSLDVKDINNTKSWYPQRQTNPLQPVYKVYDDKNQIQFYGKVEKSEPKILHPNNFKSPNYAYNNQDIEGSQAYSLPNKFLMKDQRKDFRNINDTADINGAQPNTVKKGIRTQRNINPLMPKYQIPGNSEQQLEFGQSRYFQGNGQNYTNNNRYGDQNQIQNLNQNLKQNQGYNIKGHKSVDFGYSGQNQLQQQQQQFQQQGGQVLQQQNQNLGYNSFNNLGQQNSIKYSATQNLVGNGNNINSNNNQNQQMQQQWYK
ncbi:hypothetical protein PPERSA_10945 [Pseudocohnilembus persalinus]|uniref:Uncharacterized protein n=1 Tax=Pseudocohnilembus persalinus TaxID=266149 RepID=A0A0V0QCB7_PSEPJ|nr:hypothetical protein PPERSA_10945 [Pseudocohnilembus persalinus]|eukprot:KRW99826.1 hypothetical protein PPERSA_10945 [Pseudocohnilembus persalinus]